MPLIRPHWNVVEVVAHDSEAGSIGLQIAAKSDVRKMVKLLNSSWRLWGRSLTDCFGAFVVDSEQSAFGIRVWVR